MCRTCQAATERKYAAERLLAACHEKCGTAVALRRAFAVDLDTPHDMIALVRLMEGMPR